MDCPEWKTFIEKSISQYPKDNVIQIATNDNASSSPRVRSQIFRSFAETPSAPNLPLVISTTDIRTPKVTQMISHPNVELVWWIPSTRQQYRIAGSVLVVPSPNHALHGVCTGILQSEELLRSSLALSVFKSEEFDWEEKRREIWGNLSPYMRATLARPTPGSTLENPDDAKKWPQIIEEPKEGDSEETKKKWEYALGNFALVVIDPCEVDYVNMGVVPNTRTGYTRTGGGKWESQAVVA
ncbi:pyridoxamine 5'-phosphate oxidase-domain-containing protein [Cyathus striatus]|nr:pyridoxamine 5'-phosphate oxidase-domain-containing protein [Cyathus striatus]